MTLTLYTNRVIWLNVDAQYITGANSCIASIKSTKGGNLGKEKLGRKVKVPGPVPNGLANAGSLLGKKNRNLLFKAFSAPCDYGIFTARLSSDFTGTLSVRFNFRVDIEAIKNAWAKPAKPEKKIQVWRGVATIYARTHVRTTKI